MLNKSCFKRLTLEILGMFESKIPGLMFAIHMSCEMHLTKLNELIIKIYVYFIKYAHVLQPGGK